MSESELMYYKKGLCTEEFYCRHVNGRREWSSENGPQDPQVQIGAKLKTISILENDE